jgi:hypothetical protein
MHAYCTISNFANWRQFESIKMKTILDMCLMYNLKFLKFKKIEYIITQKTLDICFMHNLNGSILISEFDE